MKLPGGGIDSRRAVEPVGVYAPFLNKQPGYPEGFTKNTNQLGLKHLRVLDSTRWNPPWTEVRAAVGGEFYDEEWKHDLWWAIVSARLSTAWR